MQAIQMEFNIEDKTEAEVKLSLIQRQIDEMRSSMSKVRKNLFAQMCELNKLYITVKYENERLKQEIKKIKNEETEWLYAQNEFLFMDKCG